MTAQKRAASHLSPEKMKVLRATVEIGQGTPYLLRQYFNLKSYQGASFEGTLSALARMNFLQRDQTLGFYTPTEAGIERASQKNPFRPRRRRPA
jgi:hypothetical protein